MNAALLGLKPTAPDPELAGRIEDALSQTRLGAIGLSDHLTAPISAVINELGRLEHQGRVERRGVGYEVVA